MKISAFFAATLLAGTAPALAELPDNAPDELRHIVGDWSVTTEFLNPDGTVRATAPGRYDFEWVMEDRIVKGMSKLEGIPGASGLLFFLREGASEIEMTSVGPDGRVWRMIGPAGGSVRETADIPTQDGGTMRLRFTTEDREADRFVSRMFISTDGGETWVPGNRQVFLRCGAAVACS